MTQRSDDQKQALERARVRVEAVADPRVPARAYGPPGSGAMYGTEPTYPDPVRVAAIGHEHSFGANADPMIAVDKEASRRLAAQCVAAGSLPATQPHTPPTPEYAPEVDRSIPAPLNGGRR